MKSLQLVLALVTLASVAQAAKILMIPGDHVSHINFMGIAAKGLLQEGHQPAVLANDRHKDMLNKLGAPSKLYHMKKAVSLGKDEAIGTLLSNEGNVLFRTVTMINTITGDMLELCREMFEDDKFMKELEDEKYDLAIVDGTAFIRCGYIFPYRLGIRYITIGPQHDPWAAGVTAMPAVEGLIGLQLLGEEASFFDRVLGVISNAFMNFMMPPMHFKDSQIAEWAPNQPKTTYTKLYTNSEVFLLVSDNICLDFPRVSAPHYHFIGATGAHPADPLPTDIQKIVDKSTHGIVIVTFGSLIKKAPPEIISKMMAAFGKFKYTFIMRYQGETPENKPSNVYLNKWLPQNDLLGNNKTVLFITHGGNNGQLETLYHGVPVITIPVFGDQIYNANRFVKRGYGKMLGFWKFSVDDLVQAIKEVTENPVYSENIKRCSAIQKDFPTAAKSLLFWVNHILKYGGSHLKPLYVNMPLYKIFGLDVLLFFLVVFLVAVYVVYRLCNCCFYCMCKSKQKVKVKSN